MGSGVSGGSGVRDYRGAGFVVSHPTDDETVRRMGHPLIALARLGFVVSHPTDDGTVRRMGHPEMGYPEWGTRDGAAGCWLLVDDLQAELQDAGFEGAAYGAAAGGGSAERAAESA